MNEKQIISLNCAGWAWKTSKESWESRLRRTCDYIKNKMSNALFIGLQEVQISGGKYIKVIEEYFADDYYVILPASYNDQPRPRSVISLLLLKKNMTDSYVINTLEGLEDSLRYNYVTVHTVDGMSIKCANLNIPHTSYGNYAPWFQDNRRLLRQCFIKNIKSLADTYKNESDIGLVIMGDYNTVPEDSFIDSLAYSYIDRPMIDAVKPMDKNKVTWRNNGCANRLDYILYNQGLLCDTGFSAKITIVDDYPIIAKFSDHAALIGGIIAS